MPTETESGIIAIIQEMKNSQDIGSGTALIDSGLLDSFDVITLLMELEKVFGVLIPGEEIVPENLGSVQDLARLVEKQKA